MDEVEKCAQCGNSVAGCPAYTFRGGIYHDWCKDLLLRVQAETEASLRPEPAKLHVPTVSLEEQIDEAMRLIRWAGIAGVPDRRLAVLRAILATLQSLAGPGDGE